MGRTNEDQYAVGSLKRRGRPPKVREAEAIEPTVIDAPEDVIPALATELPQPDALAQELALRIWNGQSPDVPREERIARIAAGLERQGFNMTEVSLP